MEIFRKFRRGIEQASYSFNLIWQHKILLAYLAIPSLIGIIITLLIHNLISTPTPLHMDALASTYQALEQIAYSSFFNYWIGKTIITYVHIAATIFFNAALIVHTFAYLQNRSTTFSESIIYAFSHYPSLLLWSLVSTGEILLGYYAASYNEYAMGSQLIYFLLLTALSAWGLLTFFVVPIITIERKSLLAAFKKSIMICISFFWQIIGGQVWIGLVYWILGTLPVVLLSIFMVSPSFFGKNFAVAGVIICAIAIRYLISTAQAIFKTIIYEYEFTHSQEFNFERENYPQF